MPLEVIEYLLENGADKNQKYTINCNVNGNILTDLKECNNPRYSEIEKLFNKY